MIPHPSPVNVADLAGFGKERSGELSTAFFDVHGLMTRLTTNSSRAASAIKNFLKAFPTKNGIQEYDIDFHLFFFDSLVDEMSPLPGGIKKLYDWGMLKIYHDNSLRFLRMDDRARVTADVETSAGVGFAESSILESDWLVTNLFFYPLWGQLLKTGGLFPLHAAGLSSEGRAALFLGRSGSGKSTLTLNLVRGGFGLLSDDTVFLRKTADGVEALSFPEEINVKEETIKLLPELSRVKKFNVNELRQKSSFSIEELYPGCVVDSAKPDLLFFPQISDSEETSVESITGTEALSESLKYGFFFLDPSTTRQHFYIMSLLAKQARCYRLYSGSDQQHLEQVISELLAEKKGSPGAGNESSTEENK